MLPPGYALTQHRTTDGPVGIANDPTVIWALTIHTGTVTVHNGSGDGATKVWGPNTSANNLRYAFPNGLWCPLGAFLDLGASSAVSVTYTARPLRSPYRDLIMGTQGLVAYFRLGSSAGSSLANDETGTVTDMAQSGGVTFGRPGLLAGDANTCADFDGVDDFLSSTNNSLRIAGDLSLECWINQDRLGNEVQDGVNSLIRCGVTGTDHLYIVSVLLTGEVRFHHHDGTANRTVTTASPVVAVGRTYHLVVTRRGGTSIDVWANGAKALDGGTITGPSQAAGSQITRIGAASATANETDGRIDEFAIYNRVLTDAEITLHYTVGRTG